MSKSTFFKLHHGFVEHAKYEPLSHAALLLHIAGCSWASDNWHTDGFLPNTRTGRNQWAARFVGIDNVDDLIGELVTASVWNDHGDAYEIVSYLEHNRSKAEIEEYRRRDAARKRNAREEAKTDANQIERQRTDSETDTGTPAESFRTPPGILPESGRTRFRGVS